MSDYVYNPTDDTQENVMGGKLSTSIKELDDLEYIDYNNQAQPTRQFSVNDINQKMYDYQDTEQKITTDMYPDLTSTPIYQQTVPVRQSNSALTNNRTAILSAQENARNAKKHHDNQLENISVKDFFSKISGSYIEIIDDLLEGHLTVDTFTKDNRLLAMGILFIIVSIFFIFFNQID